MCSPARIISVLVEIQHGDNARFGFIRENYSTFITESLDVSDQRTRRNQVSVLTNTRRSQLQTFEDLTSKPSGTTTEGCPFQSSELQRPDHGCRARQSLQFETLNISLSDWNSWFGGYYWASLIGAVCGAGSITFKSSCV